MRPTAGLASLFAAFALLAPALAHAQSADGFDKSLDDQLAGEAQADAEKGDAMPGEKP